MKIYALIKDIQWKSIISPWIMHDFIRWKQNSTDNPYNILTVNMGDSKTKVVETELIKTSNFESCRDRDSSRPRNLKDVETETSRD